MELNLYLEDPSEIELYDNYLRFIERYVKDQNIDNKTKKKMISKLDIKRIDDSTWFLQEGNKNVNFISFHSWLKCLRRDEKLRKLGI